MKEIVLFNDKIKMGVLPELGGAVSFFKYFQKDKFVDIMRPYEKSIKGDDASNASMFVMVPFCSRIRGGSFVYWGITRKMQKDHQGISDPIHGDGWKSSWDVISQTDTKIEMKLIHKKENGGFPFSYESTIIYELKDDQFKINISVKNLNTLPMPCGFGIHPFFVKTKETELDFTSTVVWSNETDPIFDKPYTTPDTWQFDGGKPIKNAVFDTCFGGFNGKASILYPDLGISVSMEADAGLKEGFRMKLMASETPWGVCQLLPLRPLPPYWESAITSVPSGDPDAPSLPACVFVESVSSYTTSGQRRHRSLRLLPISASVRTSGADRR
jgi:aldose 1-epimerase